VPLTQTQLKTAVADRAEAKHVLGVLEKIVLEELGNAQKVRTGGVAQRTVRVKPAQKARKGRNPAAGEEITIAAEPASVDLRAGPLAEAKAALPTVQKSRRRVQDTGSDRAVGTAEPSPLAPSLVLYARPTRIARLCSRVDPAAPIRLPTPPSPLVESPKRARPGTEADRERRLLLSRRRSCLAGSVLIVPGFRSGSAIGQSGSHPGECRGGDEAGLVADVGGPGFRAKRRQPRSGYRVGSLSQESLPQRRERGRGFGAALRGVMAAAECVEQIRAVGSHQ
jgi:nucleoid DNA-binding protein